LSHAAGAPIELHLLSGGLLLLQHLLLQHLLLHHLLLRQQLLLFGPIVVPSERGRGEGEGRNGGEKYGFHGGFSLQIGQKRPPMIAGDKADGHELALSNAAGCEHEKGEADRQERNEAGHSIGLELEPLGRRLGEAG
jgi:hypothetical protein